MDGAADVSQSHVASCISVRQVLVVESKDVQNRCVQVVNVHRVVHRFIAKFVSLAICHAGYNTTSGEPEGKTFVVVISSVIILPVRSATELASPNDERIIE